MADICTQLAQQQAQIEAMQAAILALQSHTHPPDPSSAPAEVLRTRSTQTPDVATTVESIMPIGDVTDINTGSYAVTAGQIAIIDPGLHSVSAYYAWAETSGNTTRNTIRLRLKINGVQYGPDYQDNYVRDATGANEAGQSIPLDYVQLAAGDIVTVTYQQVAGSGGVMGLTGGRFSMGRVD